MKRVIAILLSLLIFALSLNVGVAFHFCGGNLAQFKIVSGYGKATCGMEGIKDTCESRSYPSVGSVPCCQDQFRKIISDDYRPTNKFEQSLFKFTTIIPQIIYNVFRKRFEFESFICYRPPPLLILVSLPFIQVFLI